MFIHLHNHTHYSILEGLPRPKDYAKKAKELGMEAVAITDTSNVYGCHELYKAAKDEGIKPILGTEIYVESILNEKINHKLVLLAKSLEGYKNIISLVSKANLDNSSRTTRIKFGDIENLKNEKGDLEMVCLSGPVSGEIPYFILAGKSDEEILKRINDYKIVFGKENYYLELLYHDDIPKQNFITDKLIELVNKYDLQAVAANNCYYISKEDKQAQDVIMAIGTGYELENPDRPTMVNGDYSFLSEEEMQVLFGFLPQALENTAKIAEMVNIEIKTGESLIPVYELPEEDQKIYEEAMKLEKSGNCHSELVSESLNNSHPNPLSTKRGNRKNPPQGGQNLQDFGEGFAKQNSNAMNKSIGNDVGPRRGKKADEVSKGELPSAEGYNIKSLTSDEWYLRYLSFSGLNTRYDANLSKEIIFKFVQKLEKPGLTKKLTETLPEELKALSLTYYSDEKKEILKGLSKDLQDKIDRLEYELVVVHEMGFDAYFLIVADYINWAKKNDIPVGPGRGSAAGSLMAYLSGITDIDPLPYQLLFERFLNPARVSMPDIDTDFSDKDRDRVVEYCRKKYGDDRVAQICTFGTFAARAAVKDVGRTFGIPFAEMNELARLIPEKPGTKLKEALEESVEFKEIYEKNSTYKSIIDNALKIEGNVRQVGVHACAVIIAPQPITNFTALQHPPKDVNGIITQYEAHALEDLGLLKMDFLGLRNLTIIKRAEEIIKNTKKVEVDILKINLDDKKVFKIFANGDTTGIFQFESDGMRKYLKDLSPDSFEDLIAMVALYRPGPLAYIPTYIDVKHGKKEKKYLTEDLIKILEKAGYSKEIIEEEGRKLDQDLSPILDITYGIPIYQEQLMFIVQYMAGFSLGEADLLRRGVGKKKKDVVEKLKLEFMEKGEKFKQYKKETTDYIYTNMIMPAADYSFNKSHAACYALIAYQTAFLKAYYKTEFMTSLMVSDEESIERIVLDVGEAQSLGISVLPPSINESMKHFTYIDDKTIRFGLKAIKGIGDGPIERIVEARKKAEGRFEDLEQFIEFGGKEIANKKTLEGLAWSGAMDDFGINRRQLVEGIPEITRFSKRDEDKKETHQIGLFDNSAAYEDKLDLPKKDEYEFEKILEYEKEILGFSVSGHALDGLKKFCNVRGQKTRKLKMSWEELQELENKKNANDTPVKPDNEKKGQKSENVQAVGVVVDIRKILTKSGKPMMFLKCEGFDYDFEVVVFPRDVDTYKDKLATSRIIVVSGFLDINFEFKRKSIKAQKIDIYTISGVRETARNLGFFDNSKKLLSYQNQVVSSSKDTGNNENEEVVVNNYLPKNENTNVENENEIEYCCEVLPENFEEELEKKIEENKAEEIEKLKEEDGRFSVLASQAQEGHGSGKYILQIPDFAKMEDFQELKEFMSSLEEGGIKIFIEFKGGQKDTKMALSEVNSLEEWIKRKWY